MEADREGGGRARLRAGHRKQRAQRCVPVQQSAEVGHGARQRAPRAKVLGRIVAVVNLCGGGGGGGSRTRTRVGGRVAAATAAPASGHHALHCWPHGNTHRARKALDSKLGRGELRVVDVHTLKDLEEQGQQGAWRRTTPGAHAAASASQLARATAPHLDVVQAHAAVALWHGAHVFARAHDRSHSPARVLPGVCASKKGMGCV